MYAMTKITDVPTGDFFSYPLHKNTTQPSKKQHFQKQKSQYPGINKFPFSRFSRVVILHGVRFNPCTPANLPSI